VVALEWCAFAAGAVLALLVTVDLFLALVVPRPRRSPLGRVVERLVTTATLVLAELVAPRRGRSDPRTRYEAADRVLAVGAPASLLVLLSVWQVGLITAYAAMLAPFSDASPLELFREAGSSFLTLGFSATDGGGATVVDFVAAVAGLISVALLIGYLPTLYGSFNRRETLVTTLESRAGAPAWGPEILARQQLVGLLDSLPGLYDDWEHWAADVAESHSNYPILIRFRSPNPYRSWIVGLVAVMDSAALYLAVAPQRAPSEARLVLRGGFTALRDVADALGLAYDPDPFPDDPVDLSREDFDLGLARLERAGFPVERSADEAWADFRGWRVNYEQLAIAIADLVHAPPAPWTGTRRHFPEQIAPRRPRNRTRDDREGVQGSQVFPGIESLRRSAGEDGSGAQEPAARR